MRGLMPRGQTPVLPCETAALEATGFSELAKGHC